ncbi:phenylacetate-CoA ligase [Paucimonas lemoignei]|uniref:Phenylacetate-CoA ligase n=2 Tax=Paucimonas lemoignei TaxID=29443 RepID=A0A4R3HR96_PAULE|nr:phenylacetate-CoA ligase [Paucimonas lemoignei]
MNIEPTDADRFPTLTDHGRRMLEFMREHPAAPIYRNQSGNRLTATEVDDIRQFEKTIRQASVGWPRDGLPAWLPEFMARTFQTVPHYRGLGSPPVNFIDLPTVSRADYAGDIAAFVPDHVELTRMINFRTTGTTGHPLLIASHPAVAGRYLAFHKRAMDRFGIELTHGRGQVGVMLLGFQRRCFTYVSVTPTMDESGLAKINLYPDDWKHPDDRARYLDAMAPEVIAGDPISFAELLKLPMTHRPRVMMSVSMTLLPALREQLESRFACPVLDIYSLNEVGPVGVFDARAGGHVLLQPHLYVEILDEQDKPVPPGDRGEITVTGGFNFCLPLLRYRTGDFASLSFGSDAPVLVGLSGRSPVRYRLPNGSWINNIDVTHALQSLPIPHFNFHQYGNGEVMLRLNASAMTLADEARRALLPLFGTAGVHVGVLQSEDKTIQYTSDLHGAME